LVYIKNMSEAGCATPPCATPTPGNAVAADAKTDSKEAGNGSVLLWALAFVLVLATILLARYINSLSRLASQKAGEAPVEEKSFLQIVLNPTVVRLLIFGLVIVGGYTTVNNAIGLGRQQNYAPEQPIKFSHELHAGKNAIDCQYCHDGARRSKHAVIPATNTCMNCHTLIMKGPEYGTAEILKIYAAAGFDPKTGTYDKSKENPIKWIKVHNLPEHVYFNHSQHVVVGKQECTTCHGNVKEMTVAEQKSPLTMKWCIECHRKTEVAMEGNAYYDKLHAYLKEKYKGEHLKTFTVAQMGGLECARCHY
jgi:hypothetical protein